MRNYLLFYINGRAQRVSGEQAFIPLSTYVREQLGITGTKVVCEEGDCGACSVIVGRLVDGEIAYRVVNSCIQFLYQLDCTHIITIEGLRYDGQLNPVQEAMVTCHGAQCGYCTPGFVVAMCALFDETSKPDEPAIKDALTGNLCRCTGYEPIIKAGLSVDANNILKLHALYPTSAMINALSEHAKQPLRIESKEHTFLNPLTLQEAVRFKVEHQGATVVAGGTDVSVYWNKRGLAPQHLLSLSLLKDLSDLGVEGNKLIVGAKTTLSELEHYIADKLPELHHILWLFGSPQIRNAATLAGNIANGSPIADSLPFLYVMEAELELVGVKGPRRVNISRFYKGYKQLDLGKDELITRIIIPLPERQESIKLYKVSKRKNLDISAFTAAFRLTLSSGRVERISIAYGGVAPVIVRLTKTEQFLAGKEFSLDNLRAAGKVALSEIAPISDVRGSSDFRAALAENILLKLFHELTSITSEVMA